MNWADALGNLAGKYLDYRRVESQDALVAQDAMFKADMLRAQAAAADESTQPGWIMPALLIGGGLLVVMLLVRK